MFAHSFVLFVKFKQVLYITQCVLWHVNKMVTVTGTQAYEPGGCGAAASLLEFGSGEFFGQKPAVRNEKNIFLCLWCVIMTDTCITVWQSKEFICTGSCPCPYIATCLACTLVRRSLHIATCARHVMVTRLCHRQEQLGWLWSMKLFSRWSISVEQSAARKYDITDTRTVLWPAEN